jgi:uncharacterized protein (TIGR02453 family)
MGNEISFTGFNRKGLTFLRQIELNNNAPWFHAHKKDYTDFLLTPMQSMFLDLADTMLSIDPLFMIDPRSGKGITRPHRDTRFAADKSPYKKSIWFTYHRALKEWQDYPAFYFEVMQKSYRFGMGFFLASRQTMTALREIIDKDEARFDVALKPVKKLDYTVEGDKYARPLKELNPDLSEWYNRKNVYLIHERKHDDLFFSAKLCKEIGKNFLSLAPLYRILCEASEKG